MSNVYAAYEKNVEFNTTDPIDYSQTNKWSGYFAIMGLVTGLANFLQVRYIAENREVDVDCRSLVPARAGFGRTGVSVF